MMVLDWTGCFCCTRLADGDVSQWPGWACQQRATCVVLECWDDGSSGEACSRVVQCLLVVHMQDVHSINCRLAWPLLFKTLSSLLLCAQCLPTCRVSGVIWCCVCHPLPFCDSHLCWLCLLTFVCLCRSRSKSPVRDSPPRRAASRSPSRSRSRSRSRSHSR